MTMQAPKTSVLSKRGVGVIISHHRSEDTLFATLDNLREHGLTPCVVVDNSEYGPGENPLTELGDDVRLITTSRQGFALAVNDAIATLHEEGSLPEFLIIGTHEVLITAGDVEELLRPLREDDDVAVAGPLVVDRDNPLQIWSAGGEFLPVTGLPVHKHYQKPTCAAPHRPYLVDWIDGCFAAVRSSVMLEYPFDESYVFTFEESDQHNRLRRAGMKVLVVPSVRVSQTTTGVPFFYLTRNFLMLRRKQWSPSAPWPGLMAMLARELYREKSLKPVSTFVRAVKAAGAHRHRLQGSPKRS